MGNTRRRWVATVTAVISLGLLAGCSEGANYSTSISSLSGETLVGRLPVLADYDAFVIGRTPDAPETADVYGLRLDPYRLDRITRGLRVSSVAATEGLLVVAAAEGGEDRLGLVNAAGGLLPVPGLGRPAATSVAIVGRTLYYADGGESGGPHRYVGFDLDRHTTTQVLRSSDDVRGIVPMPGGRHALLRIGDGRADDEFVVRDRRGRTTAYPLRADVTRMVAGDGWIAATAPARNGVVTDATTLLLNLSTGRITRMPGYRAAAASPDGSRLLLVGDESDDPMVEGFYVADPTAPRRLTGLSLGMDSNPTLIGGGVWFRGDAPDGYSVRL
ncbi:hypothetical protein GCM10009547_09410 [Sporichthya brevicatena]|uniref:Lipoprotein n=1 Tax=Sporichthya brevicatena TaxID=171442 RepID=A0ABN1GDU0_9ACTN